MSREVPGWRGLRHVPGRKVAKIEAWVGWSEAPYEAAEVEFMCACEKEKRRLGRITLTPRQILMVAKRLGWRKES